MIHGPNGDHLCKVLEPLGRTLRSILEIAFGRRASLNGPQHWLGKVMEGDPWSAHLAKKACLQILLGIHFLHSQRIANRDIQPGNVCVALPYDLSSLDENEIQKSVWPTDYASTPGDKVGKPEHHHTEGKDDKDSKEDHRSQPPSGTKVNSPSDSESDSDYNLEAEWQRELEERTRLAEEKWNVFEPGNLNSETLSLEWSKANLFQSRRFIELLERRDGQPPRPGEIPYTVAAMPLPDSFDLETVGLSDQPFRLVLIDPGFACTFDQCERRPLHNLSDFRPPEALLNLPATHKADIFSTGVLFWEIMMLRRLVETQYFSHDPECVH